MPRISAVVLKVVDTSIQTELPWELMINRMYMDRIATLYKDACRC